MVTGTRETDGILDLEHRIGIERTPVEREEIAG